MRIDEILLREGLVTDQQIAEALEIQREEGGRIGSLLLRLGYLDEEGLLRALSVQLNCESVILSNVDLPPEITDLLPANVAIARCVFPFAYDPVENLLKIACEDPTDQDLQNELNFVAGGRKVQLYVAAERPLRAAIEEYYGKREAVSAADEQGLSILNDNGDMESVQHRGTILLVSDEPEADRPLCQALEQENYQVVSIDSADDAIELIGSQSFHTVFIRDTVQGDYIDLIDRLRKVSPRTVVRYYESPAQILVNQDQGLALSDLISRSLQLFTSLLGSKENLEDNHAGTVGEYVDRLCQQMGIPVRDRLHIVAAAYLHDLSRFYYGESKDAPDCRSRIPMTAKLLSSLNYPPLVTEILRSMYIDLKQKFTKRLPIEKLGGNIVTLVDIFCENINLSQKISLDKFETIRSKLTALTGKLFLPEVVEAFLEMIEAEILIEPPAGKHNQVLLFGDDEEALEPIVRRLKSEGFRPVALDSMDRFLDLYRRSKPDMIVVLDQGRSARAIALIDEMMRHGVEIIKVPTFLLTSQQAAPEVTSLFDRGLEDIIPFEGSLDMLAVKLRKLRLRMDQKAAQTKSASGGAGTSGNLRDMNLIDLLQALGPGRRTARITVTSDDRQLLLYLDRGQITFAESDGRLGAEAVYGPLSWVDGSWQVEPIEESQLPEPNNDLPNESILMEGCRLLDETGRSPIIK